MVSENKNQYSILKLDETQSVTFCTVLSLSLFFLRQRKFRLLYVGDNLWFTKSLAKIKAN